MTGLDADALRRRRARERARRVARRRQRAVGGLAAGVLAAFIVGVVIGAGGGPATGTRAARRTPLPALPDGTRTIFPRHRVVAYYGAAGDAQLGVLGATRPDRAARALAGQARVYARRRRPVLRAFELVATIATRSPGDDGRYRARASDRTVARYLAAAHRAHALLILDVQPGQAGFLDEVRHYARWLADPDVGIALDAEWSVPPGAIPGQVFGSTDAATVNRVSSYVAGIVRRHRLPQKLFIVHYFTPHMLRDKPAVLRRAGLATTLNLDGVGGRAEKVAKYHALHGPRADFHGFKLFYRLDTRLLTPRQVLALRPSPDLVVYQ